MGLHICSQRFNSLRQVSVSDFSSVYHAVDAVGKHEVAMKVAAGTSRPYREALLKEFDFLSRCDHPNIIEVHDLSNVRSDSPFFTMKWVDGCTLSSAEQIFGPRAVIDAIPSLCRALAEVHDMGYVYGDLHPSNVLLSKSNSSVLTTLVDFGLVSRIGTAKPKELWGVAEYIPPEVRRGDPVGPASDVYSFGVLLHRLFWGDGAIVPMMSAASVNSEQLRELIDRCIEYYPESRPQDFYEIGRVWSGRISAPQENTEHQALVGRSQRRAIGQIAQLRQIEDYAENLKAQGGGLITVSGFAGVGKSALVDRYRRKLQARDCRTLRIVCDDLQQDYGRIVEAIREAIDDPSAIDRGDADNACKLFLFMKVRGRVDLQGEHISLLLAALLDHRVVGLIECDSTAEILPAAGIKSLNLRPLARKEFDRLCETLFADTPVVAATSAFLYAASGGLPGPVTQKYREYAVFLQERKANEPYNWRKCPRESAEEWGRPLQSLGTGGREVIRAIAAVRAPFSIQEIAVIAGIAEETAGQWIRRLVQAGYLTEIRECQSTRYTVFSIWVADVLDSFAGFSLSSHVLNVGKSTDQRRSAGDSGLYRSSLADPARLVDKVELPAEYNDMRNLPYAVGICRRLVHDQAQWSGIRAGVRRSLFATVIANYESVAEESRASRWAWRQAMLELRMTAPGHSPGLADISDSLQLFNRHCTSRQKSEWMAELCRKHPQLDHSIRALLLSEQGVVDLAHNQLERALGRFFEAEALYEKHHLNDHRRARNLNRIGIIYNNQKNYATALKYYDLARRKLRDSPDPETAAIIDLNIGLLKYSTGKSRESLAHLMAAREYAKKTHHLQILGFVTRNLILSVADLRPASEAVRYAEESLSLLRNADEQSNYAMAYCNLGWVHLRNGNVLGAYSNLMHGVDLARRIHDIRWLSIGYLNLARLFFMQGNKQKSVLFALKSLLYARQQHSRGGAAEACRVISSLLSCAGDCRRASRYLSHALRYRSPGVDQRNDFFTDMTEVEVLLRQGALSRSGELLERWAKDEADLPPGWVCMLQRFRGLHYLAGGLHREGANALRDAACNARALGRYDLLIPIYENLIQAYATAVSSRAALPYAHELRRLYRKVNRMSDDDKLESAIRELAEKSDDGRFAEMVLRLSESLAKFPDKHKLLGFLLQTAVDYFGADRGALISRHPTSKGLFIEAQCGLKSGIDEDDTLEISRSVIRRVSRTSQFVKIDNAPEDPLTKTKKSILQHNIQAVMCVPIFHAGEIWGVLYLDNRSVPGAFMDSNSKMLQALANFMTLAIAQSDEISRLRLRDTDTIRVGKGGLRFVAESPKMLEVLDLADRIADSDVTVLLMGENGTGKDVLAAYIHQKSGRKAKPFVPMNCAGLVSTLADAELFGIEDKVATGVEFREGKFKLADGGTLFLNEIGDLPLSIQAKLLTALTDGKIERVGGKPMDVDVRFIAATNKNLEKMVQAETFRLDLYYRINTIKITIPPLRDRAPDIPILARVFLDHYRAKYGRNRLRMGDEVINELCTYSWPGNVRELKGMIERGVLLAKDDQFPAGITAKSLSNQKTLVLKKRNLPQVLEDQERQMVIEALELEAYNQCKAANRLGIVESTLRTKMRKLGIKKPRRL